METCIAVDVGGTKILTAEVRRDGQPVHILRQQTQNVPAAEKLEIVLRSVEEYEREYGWENGRRPVSCGIGYNSLVDPFKGIWLPLAQSTGTVPVRQIVEERLRMKCYTDNDVKCTVMAENEYGVGQHSENITYINAGTGLACGSVSSGRLLRGSDGFAGEAGFLKMTDPRNGESCSESEKKHGQRDSDVEMVSSGMGLVYRYACLRSEYPDSCLHQVSPVRGKDIVQAAKKNDPLACRLMKELYSGIGLLISNLVPLLSPEIIVLGGGLIRDQHSVDCILETVSHKALEHLEKGLVLTGLDPDLAGLKGAACLGFGFQSKYYGRNI